MTEQALDRTPFQTPVEPDLIMLAEWRDMDGGSGPVTESHWVARFYPSSALDENGRIKSSNTMYNLDFFQHSLDIVVRWPYYGNHKEDRYPYHPTTEYDDIDSAVKAISAHRTKALAGVAAWNRYWDELRVDEESGE